MILKYHIYLFSVLVAITGSIRISAFSPDPINFIPDSYENQFTTYLDQQIDRFQLEWIDRFESRMDQDIPGHYRDSTQVKFLKMLGKFPDKTPLNPRITGSVHREGYRVEKIIFESRPAYFITALLFIPDSDQFSAPFPGVLIPSGHSMEAKGHSEYQLMGALCALNGMMALVYDPPDQGERLQLPDSEGRSKYWGTRSHNMAGIKCSLLGQELANYFVWDGIRAIDFLSTRKDVDPERLGITGNSGGGVQTSYLFIADRRLKVAAPSCYIHNIFTQMKLSMGDSEQNFYGQVKKGIDHADYVMARAPAPYKILAATHDFFDINAVWETYRYAKRYFTKLGFSENIEILENNAGHNYNSVQREAAARWLYRWLQEEERVIEEPDIEILTPNDYLSTPNGQVMMLPGARSIHDLFKTDLGTLRDSRSEFLKTTPSREIVSKIRTLSSISELDQLNPVEIDSEIVSKGKGFNISELVLKQHNGWLLPARLYIPSIRSALPPVLLVSENGRHGHSWKIDSLISRGHTVLAVDLIGTGELQQNVNSGRRLSERINWEDAYKAHLMGRSIVGYRAEDILNCSRYLAEEHSSTGKINLSAFGEVCIPALHAAVTASTLFEKIEVDHYLNSWEDVVNDPYCYNQLVNVVYGALKYYDIPDLIKFMGEKISAEDPVNAGGFSLIATEPDSLTSTIPRYSGLAGVWYGRHDLSNPEGPEAIYSLEASWDPKLVKRGNDWALCWEGFVKGPATGSVTFTVESNQALSLFINDSEIVTVNMDDKIRTGNTNMAEGKLYPIRIIYKHDSEQSGFMKIRWNWNNSKLGIIPADNLTHSYQQRSKMQTEWR